MSQQKQKSPKRTDTCRECEDPLEWWEGSICQTCFMNIAERDWSQDSITDTDKRQWAYGKTHPQKWGKNGY